MTPTPPDSPAAERLKAQEQERLKAEPDCDITVGPARSDDLPNAAVVECIVREVEQAGHSSMLVSVSRIRELLTALASAERASRDSLGLSIDMLDVDLLRRIPTAVVLDGAEIAQVYDLANRLEQAVRDIGVLRGGARANAD